MLCCWAVLPTLCHLYKTAFSLLMPSKYSAQKTFQFHGLKAVLVRKNFCLKEMYKTISWGVGKPNMNIAIFIGGKKKIVIKVALLTQGSPTLCLLILSPPSWIYLCKKTFLLLNLTTKEGGVLSLKRKQQPSTIFFYKSYIFLFFR